MTPLLASCLGVTPPLHAPGAYASSSFARRFHTLRRFLDHGPLLQAIEQIAPLRGRRVVELGAGTGAISEGFARCAKDLHALDRSPAMLVQARAHMQRLGLRNTRFLLADHRALPFPSGTFDVSVAAFALDSLLHDSSDTPWWEGVGMVTQEMLRILVPGGTAFVIATPFGRPNLALHLIRERGFSHRFLSCRWTFPSRRLARAATRFFFGERAWREYAPHWPKALATPVALLWTTSSQAPAGAAPAPLRDHTRPAPSEPRPL